AAALVAVTDAQILCAAVPPPCDTRGVRSLVVATLLSLAACGDGGGPPHTHPLWADGDVLRDDLGRVALLRGINARVDGVFDVTFTDGPMPVEPVPALTAAACTRMRQLGFQ